MRVLGVIRLSRETESTTSPERQRELIVRWAEANGYEIVGWAEDLGVSASVDPWERPGLGPWLRGERGPFDVIACWRTDRVARRVLHFARMLDWLRENSRTLVSVTEGFDLATPMGRMMAQLIAMLAEGELEAIKERTKGSYDHLTKVGRHRGGFTPLGYRPVPNEDGAGWVLEIDPDGEALIKEIVGRVMAGASINSIVADLNERGVPTSLDVQRVRAGKKPKGALWRVGNLSRVLRSRTLLGYLETADGTPITDDAGMRVRRAKPILTEEEWAALQREIDDRADNRRPRPRTNAALLLHVALCGVCESHPPMYTAPGRSSGYYRCSSKSVGGVGCENGSTRADWLEQHVADEFLSRVGDWPVTRRVFVLGESHAAEIAETEEALGRLIDRLERIPTGGAAESAVLARMAEHEQRIAALRALPEVADSWMHEPTGETFREVWERDPEGRRGLLLAAGVRVFVRRVEAKRRGAEPEEVRFEIGEFGDEYDQRMREIVAEEAS
ncbi:recombinase family protein [Catellatospora methionotrophica]|uniref:recombinase family protein n=1 Tax=Catellatospora methionotrophica TaxID=121620 RepID=UPI0033C50D4A